MQTQPTPDVVPVPQTFGMLAHQFGVRRGNTPDAPDRDPRIQLGLALERLYAALNDLHRGDPLPLRHVWSHADDATLLSPTAGLLTTWDAIRTELDRQSRNPDHRNVIADDVAITLTPDTAWALCTERTTHPQYPSASTLHHSTNIFRRESGTWRLTHRHTTP